MNPKGGLLVLFCLACVSVCPVSCCLVANTGQTVFKDLFLLLNHCWKRWGRKEKRKQGKRLLNTENWLK